MAAATALAALPSVAEADLAKNSGRLLAARQSERPLRLALIDDPDHCTIQLSASVVRVLVRVLEETGRGNAVTLIPVQAELTTQEAADMLNISRPSLILLLEQNKIEYRKVGTHRRVRFEAVMAYKRQADAARQAVLAELAAYDQEIGI